MAEHKTHKKKEKEKEPEKTMTITILEYDARVFLQGLKLTSEVQGYSSMKEFLEINSHFKPIALAIMKAHEFDKIKDRIVVGNAYYYYGDTKLYRGKICTIIDLHEYKEHQTPDSYVYVNFPPTKGKWAVRIDSLSTTKR